METTETKDIKLDLLQSVNGNSNHITDNTYQPDHFKDLVEKEYPLNEMIEKLSNVREDKVKIKELILQLEPDFIKSAEQLKSVFDTEFKNMVKTLNEKFNNEVIKIQQLYRKEMLGEGLIKLVNEVSRIHWTLVMKEKSVNLYKCYNPPFEVNEGFYESGEIRDYEKPVTSLRGIYVNILHPKVTTGTIHLSTEGGRHPNCDSPGFGVACAGTLEGKEVSVTDTDNLISLLDEISSTYERMHLDSAYFEPVGSFKIRKEKAQWTT